LIELRLLLEKFHTMVGNQYETVNPVLSLCEGRVHSEELNGELAPHTSWKAYLFLRIGEKMLYQYLKI